MNGGGCVTSAEVYFEIDGKVRGKGRPRAVCVNGKPRLYTPKTTRDWEAKIAGAAHRALVHGIVPPFFRAGTAVEVEISVFVKDCLKKPDADNVAKSVLDAMNGVVYADDSQVVDLVVQKTNAMSPSLSVLVTGWVSD